MGTFYRYPNGEVYEYSFTPSGDGAEKLSRAAGLVARREYVRAELLKLLQPGDTVYTIVRHVARSGMQRRISLYVMRDNEPRNIDQYAADLLQQKNHESGGIVVNGCGMDMCFHLVYSLGSQLWPSGTETPHGTRNGAPDSDGGYALKKRDL